MTALLQLRDVEARYGAVKVLHGIALEVGAGELVAVLGANGAGKTTTLRAVSGTVRRTGDVIFDGHKLPRRPDAAARAGIAHVPEGRGTFSELSVWENLRLGAYTRRGSPKDDARRVFDYFPRLEERKGQQAGNLALAHAVRAYVLEVGNVVVSGASEQLRANESVRRSYLGY